jgi:hypothetical protein
MKIDHVSVAGHDLKRLEGSFAEARMETVYGGPHSGGETEMSLLGFRDGSYIELISIVKGGTKASLWNRQIAGDGGPCAWAVEVEDIAGEISKAKKMAIPTSGPGDYSRKRPDGVSVEWQLGFLGDGEPGAVLPFLINDKTPRDYRVKPSPSVASGPLKGIGTVVIGVERLDTQVPLFKRMYGWDEPDRNLELWDGVELARFPGTPVILAAPSGPGWLTERVDRFGQCPCSFLIEATDLHLASGQYPLEQGQKWFGGATLRWIAPLKRDGIMIGVVGR